MPSFSRNNDGFDKEYFEELQKKCLFLGISLSEKDFKKNPEKYAESVRDYNDRIKNYLHNNRNRLKILQEQFEREDNMPASMAFGKATMVLIEEAHQQLLAEKMAETAFDKIQKEYNFSIKELYLKNNRDKFELLARKLAVSADDLESQLRNAENIGEALLNSNYRNDLPLLAFDDDTILNAATAMAEFPPFHPSRETLMQKAARDTAGKMRFAELAKAAAVKSASKENTSAANKTENIALVKSDEVSTEAAVAKLLAEFSNYKDNQRGTPLLEQRANALNKRVNFVYLERTLNAFNLRDQEARNFRMALSRHKGSLKDFLEHYNQVSLSSRQIQQPDPDNRNDERQNLVSREAEKKHKEEEKQRKAALKRQKKEEEILRREAEKKRKEEEKQRKAALKQQKKEEEALRRETEKKRKEEEKQRKAALKRRQKSLRKARFRSWFRRLKSRVERKKHTTLETIVSACRSVVNPVKMTAEKVRKLFLPKQEKIREPKRKKTIKNLLSISRGENGSHQNNQTVELHIDNDAERERREKKARIIDFKQKVREKSKKTLKYAAISVPLVGMSYLGFEGIKNTESTWKINKISMTADTTPLSRDVLNKAAIFYANLNEPFGFHTQDYALTEPYLTWNSFMNPPEQPINEADYDVPIPLIKNDKLHNVPNIDFFNLCFNKSNETYGEGGKYGISRELYAKFMKNQKATAKFYNVGSYEKLSFDDARIIAKNEIFDKYGIGYIQNRSIASYLYYSLIKNQDNCASVAAIAYAVTDFYDLNGKTLTDGQRQALDNLGNNRNVNPDDWHEMIAAINAMASEHSQESNLFTAIQQSQFNMPIPYDVANTKEIAKQLAVNLSFVFEPTLNIGGYSDVQTSDDDLLLFADAPFLTNISNEISTANNEKEILEARKQKEVETFCKIYAQCSYKNVIRLSYGEKGQAFDDANKTLARQGIYGKIDRRLYCAGMSMASFCQAYEIFKKENPESFVSEAVSNIIEKCRINAHSTTGMRDIYKKHSKHVVYSNNLEQDIKSYMRKHPNSILQSGFRRNSAGNQHYNGFFPSTNPTSNDAYTYCAFNNNHWGNEKTFSNVLHDRHRSQFGRGGWYIDITAWINDEADILIKQEIKKRAELRQKHEVASPSHTGQFAFSNFAHSNSR